MISKVSEQNEKGDDEGFIFDRNLNGINEEYLNDGNNNILAAMVR